MHSTTVGHSYFILKDFGIDPWIIWERALYNLVKVTVPYPQRNAVQPMANGLHAAHIWIVCGLNLILHFTYSEYGGVDPMGLQPNP